MAATIRPTSRSGETTSREVTPVEGRRSLDEVMTEAREAARERLRRERPVILHSSFSKLKIGKVFPE